jgi:hypothetical protein
MKSFKMLLAAALFALTTVSGAGAAHAALAVDFATPSDTFSNDATTSLIVGWQFTAATTLDVQALGFYLPNAGTSSTVGLWDVTSQSLIASATVSSSDPVKGNNFHFAAINPVSVIEGGNYIVAGTTTNANLWTGFDKSNPAAVNFTGLVFNKVSFVQDAFVDSTSLIYPIGSANQDPGFGLANATIIGGFGANLDVTPTPIPGAVYLLGSGLVGLAGLRRRN